MDQLARPCAIAELGLRGSYPTMVPRRSSWTRQQSSSTPLSCCASLDAALHGGDRHARSCGCIGLIDAFQIANVTASRYAGGSWRIIGVMQPASS